MEPDRIKRVGAQVRKDRNFSQRHECIRTSRAADRRLYYSSYIRSFIGIRDQRVDALVTSRLNQGRLWPDPLIQLNPSFQYAGTIEDLVAEGVLHSECNRIPVAYPSVARLLLVTALAAMLAPARRTTRSEPLAALRQD
jgi:hypothetical protein